MGKINEEVSYAKGRVRRIYDLGRYYGIGAVAGKVKRKLARTFTKTDPENLPEVSYAVWKKNCLKDLKFKPKETLTFGVLITDLPFSANREAVEKLPVVKSLRAQTLKNYKLCRAERMEEVEADYVLLVHGCDRLELRFLAALTAYITEKKDRPAAVYTDEDVWRSENGMITYSEPCMKPDYSPDYQNGYNYIRRMTAVTKEIYLSVAEDMNCPPSEISTEFIFRVCEKAAAGTGVGHLALPFYSMRENEYEIPMQDPDVVDAHLDRIGVIGTCALDENGFVDVQYPLLSEPLVSVIIPNKDHREDLKRTLESCFAADYKNCEYIIVENNSEEPETFDYYEELKKREDVKVRVTTWRGKGFNYSALNNHGAKKAEGEYLLLLNNDMEVINPDFMREMLRVVERTGTGIVGARLYYEDESIQHAGVFVGYCGVADGNYRGLAETPERLKETAVMHEVSAVTAACLMIRRTAYLAMGGMDESFAVNFNDVDFCLRVGKRMQKIVYVPRATLYHFESKSRGQDVSHADMSRVYDEIENFTKHWHGFVAKGDPYYNANLTKNKVDHSLKEWRFDEV